MAKLDEVKEFINYLKVFLVILFATNLSLIGWLVNNMNRIDEMIYKLAILAVLSIAIILIMLNKKIIKDIKSLKEL